MAPHNDVEEHEEAAGPRELGDQVHKAFAKYYRTLPQVPNTVRFFDRKGFYTCHGEDALLVARLCYRTTAVVKQGGGTGPDSLSYVNLNRATFESALRELLLGGSGANSSSSGYIVELYEQSGQNWRLAKTASPGKLNAFEEELYRNADMADVPLVAALTFMQLDMQMAGVAFVDSAGCHLGACELQADPQLSGLEAVLVQLGAREVVVNKDAVAQLEPSLQSRLTAVLDGVGALTTLKPASLFSAKHLAADLGKIIKGGAVERHGDVLERRAACSALAAALAYSDLLSDTAASSSTSGAGGRYSLALYNPGCYMRLDATALRALNIMPQRSDASATFSLYGLLNRCRTAGGKRRLKAWLKQPLVDLEAIAARHDVVEAVSSDADLRGRLRDMQLRGLPDVERLTRKLQSRRTSLQDLHQLYRASARLPLIEEALRCHEGPHATRLVASFADPLAAAHAPAALQQYEGLLEAALDCDKIPEEYLISASYSPALNELQKRKQEYEAEVLRCAQAAATDLGLVLDKTIKLEWHKPPGAGAAARTRCLRITQKEEKNVRAKMQAKYVVIEARKDGTKFTNKALREAADKLAGANAQYLGMQAELVEQVVEVAATYTEVWEGVAGLLADLDVLAALAESAALAPVPYVRPVMLPADSGELVLRGSRHPCVEVQDGVSFIANDCELKRGSSWLHIITGPNMGGKSTYIRQVGVAVLLAQVGSFVPAESARIAVRDSIFCRVGAGDCQQRGVSTFMAEMLETAAILRGATSHSLVIIDELGRGTSTYDGFGLAWAIAEHIATEIQAPCLFATHFHELTELTAPVGVRNSQAAAMLDPSTQRLTMLYEIREGACDQSFGVHVAATAGFPPDVITLANQRLKQLEEGEGKLRELHNLAPAAKRQKTDAGAKPAGGMGMPEGAMSFLRQFAALPLDTMSAPDALAAVTQLVKAA